jgi:hypothetical protein
LNVLVVVQGHVAERRGRVADHGAEHRKGPLARDYPINWSTMSMRRCA